MLHSKKLFRNVVSTIRPLSIIPSIIVLLLLSVVVAGMALAVSNEPLLLIPIIVVSYEIQ